MIELKVTGIEEARAELSTMAQRLSDLTPPMKAAGAAITKFIDDRFDTSTGPDGKEWPKLAASTLKYRRSGSSKPLVDTQILRNSIHADAYPDHVKWGTNVIYAATHHFGDEERGIPARPFLPIEMGPGGDLVEMQGGLALRLWERIQGYIDSYVDTGRLR